LTEVRGTRPRSICRNSRNQNSLQWLEGKQHEVVEFGGIRMVGANGFEPSTSWSRTRRASQAALRPDRQAELSASHFASRLAQLSTHSYTRLVPCLGRGVLFAQSLRFAG